MKPMTHTPFYFVLFFIGLAVTCWIGGGYVGSNLPGVTVTALIAACYAVGGMELYRYRQATASLVRAVSDTTSAQSSLGAWLERLPAALRPAVRLRVEGERVGLPAPALTPYLVGLLVLLGMLGTLLGMMVTLRGTGLALENATDLDSIRGSLAAPVHGLGFAFGTSIAGVATSALLGLLSALCRRERLGAAQALDAEIAGSLRVHSQAWQREESFRLLQRQAEAMPMLLDRLQGMIGAIEQQNTAQGERLIASQQEFHARAETAHARLGVSLEQSLKAGADAYARATAAASQSAMEATLAGLAREAGAVHEAVTRSVTQQLDALASGFTAASEVAASSWNGVLDEQRRSHEAMGNQLQTALDAFTARFGAHATQWVDQLGSRLDERSALDAQSRQQALAQQDQMNAVAATRNEQALAAASEHLGQQAGALVRTIEQSHAGLLDALSAHDEARLSAWSEKLERISASLREDWDRATAGTAEQHARIGAALVASADEIGGRAQLHASETIAEISRLVEVASEAPRAAADVIAEMRQQLSDSMVRDTAMLDERNQLMGTLQTLLDAVNHASTEQRSAVDALVVTSSDLLESVGSRFIEHIQSETGKLDSVAAQVSVSAVEVASLAEAFGSAVEMFGQTNTELLARLHGIGEALDRSSTRSDEQLAYYVAQAREVVDLSLLAQQQIVGELQQLGGRRGATEASAA